MIQIANLNHLKEISSIENKSFDFPWTITQIKKDLDTKLQSENWVYLINKRVVGYVLGNVLLDEYHLNNIAVHPEYLCKKIGTKLVTFLIKHLKKQNINVILLEVSTNNIPANKFYKSLGFIKVGMRKKYYANGENALLLNLNINNYG